MNIYICDDNAAQLEQVWQMAQALSCPGDSIECCSTGVQLLALLSADTANQTCILLDIELSQKGEGILLGKEINRRYPYVPIILCTAYRDYSSDLWNVNYCTFLTKPIQKIALQTALEKASGLLTARFLTVTTPEGILQIPQRYFSCAGRRVFDPFNPYVLTHRSPTLAACPYPSSRSSTPPIMSVWSVTGHRHRPAASTV